MIQYFTFHQLGFPGNKRHFPYTIHYFLGVEFFFLWWVCVAGWYLMGQIIIGKWSAVGNLILHHPPVSIAQLQQNTRIQSKCLNLKTRQTNSTTVRKNPIIFPCYPGKHQVPWETPTWNIQQQPYILQGRQVKCSHKRSHLNIPGSSSFDLRNQWNRLKHHTLNSVVPFSNRNCVPSPLKQLYTLPIIETIKTKSAFFRLNLKQSDFHFNELSPNRQETKIRDSPCKTSLSFFKRGRTKNKIKNRGVS